MPEAEKDALAALLGKHRDDMETGDYGEVLWSGCVCGDEHPYDKHDHHLAEVILCYLSEAARATEDDPLRTALKALDARWCESISHGTERGEPWAPWLTARVREIREVLKATECGSCGESPNNECPKSKRACGHHCNHVWEQDICHWCGTEFGETTDVVLRPGFQAGEDRG